MQTRTTNWWPPWRRVAVLRALAAGLAGAIANTLTIRLVKLFGIEPGSGGLAEMTLAQGNFFLEALGLDFRLAARFDPVGQEVFHTAMGLIMALVYSILFYRLLPGPGWLRGFLFCQLPWLMQVFLVLPWTGAGVLGLKISILTPFASFLLNAIYGVILGAIYRPCSTEHQSTPSLPTTPTLGEGSGREQ